MRRAAALQIGELQKDNPLGAQGLIAQVAQRLLHADSWNTRVAACQALEAVLAHLPAWAPAPGRGVPEAAVCRAALRMPPAPAGATLASFSLAAACALPRLLGSRGDEYNDSDSDRDGPAAPTDTPGVRRDRTTRQAACERRRNKRARPDGDSVVQVKQDTSSSPHYVATEQPNSETKLLIETLPQRAVSSTSLQQQQHQEGQIEIKKEKIEGDELREIKQEQQEQQQQEEIWP